MNDKATKRGPGRPRKQRTARELRSDIAAYGRVVSAVARYVATRKRLDRTFEPDGDHVVVGPAKDGSIELVWERGTARTCDEFRTKLAPGDLVDPEGDLAALREQQKTEIAQLRALWRKYPDVELDEDGDEEGEKDACDADDCGCDECCGVHRSRYGAGEDGDD